MLRLLLKHVKGLATEVFGRLCNVNNKNKLDDLHLEDTYFREGFEKPTLYGLCNDGRPTVLWLLVPPDLQPVVSDYEISARCRSR